jgi:hypothetical protein
MPHKGWRIFAGIAWVVGSLVAWAVVCNVLGFVVFMYLGNERGMNLPEWSTDVFNWTSIAGIVLIPPVVAVLAIRAYLPGTGKRAPRSRGFAIIEAAPLPGADNQTPERTGPSERFV